MSSRHTISSLSDADLVAAYKKSGDLELVAQLYQRYADLVYGVCLKYLKVAENAQDSSVAIFEELTVKLLKHEVDNFKSWLYTVAKNHCLMRLRREKKGAVVPFDLNNVQSEDNWHLQDVMEKEATFRQLEYCMAQLGEEQKKVIELFYLEGKCYNEIAANTGLEWNQVRSFIQNGRRNLKICMEKQKTPSAIQ